MIQPQTYFSSADNTGATTLMCINILGSNKFFGNIADMAICVVKTVQSESSVKIASIVRSIIVRTRKNLYRQNGVYISFADNAVVILDNKNIPVGSRIIGPIAVEVRSKNLARVISLATDIL